MINLNTCTILGRLVREPAIHNSLQGSCAIFTVATNRRWTDKNGNQQTETAFVPCKAFNGWTKGLQGLEKGTPILVSGRLRTENWEAEGTMRSQLCLTCDVVQSLEAAKPGAGGPCPEPPATSGGSVLPPF
jgi:single stranded DNA-binding protein